MRKRITRFCVELLNRQFDGSYGIGCEYRWSRGSESIKEVYDKLHIFNWKISYEGFWGMILDCKENRNILVDIDNHTALSVRRWSYHRKMD